MNNFQSYPWKYLLNFVQGKISFNTALDKEFNSFNKYINEIIENELDKS